MGSIDYWCNLFTREAIEKYWYGAPEVADVIRWWGMEDRVQGRTVDEMVAAMDEASVDIALVPSAKMRSYKTSTMLWDVTEEEIVDVVEAAPGRFLGLVGINPFDGMEGVRRLAHWVESGPFVGAHLHPYGFDLPINHRRFYPFYTKCAELGVPVVMQVGHSAEQMPSAAGRPILLDDIALDFPELKIVAAHTGWPWVDELIALAWKHRNVYIGTSAHHPRYWDPSLVRFASGRGRGKVLFGTDYPVMDYVDSVAAVRNLDMKEAAIDLILGTAAREVFNLPEAKAAKETT